MKNNDIPTRDEARSLLQKAIRDNDTEGFASAFETMLDVIEQSVKADYEAKIAAMRAENDAAVLTQRGANQLTSEERTYYQKLVDAMRAPDPKQALQNADLIMPETVIDRVFSELQTAHPLLSKIRFVSTGGAVKMLMNTNGFQKAVWGPLCGEVIKELISGFKEVKTDLLKLSAFIPVCKALLELGPEWLDDYIRQVLYEALSNGLEAGIVHGTGSDEPIGMDRNVAPGVSVVNGVYPRKTAISVTNFSATTYGKLIAMLAVDENGKPRTPRDLILIVNPQDYYELVMPATTVMLPDGSYRNNVLPVQTEIIPSAALERGEAILGLAERYMAFAGLPPEGRITYDDSVRFLEDERVYLIKLYANGLPMDNNSFMLLDISGLQPINYTVTVIDPPAASTDATLSALRIGALPLSPAFASGTTTYTAATTNATNTITATPSDAGATVSIKVGDMVVDNGAAATWASGANTVTITVTAEDGTTTKTYTVTVTATLSA